MKKCWYAWWILLVSVLVFQWPNRTIWDSGKLTWAFLGVVAGVLSLCDDSVPRRSMLGGGAFLLMLLFVYQFSIVLPSMVWKEWTETWGMVASFGSALFWSVCVLWGTASAIRYSPPVSRFIAPAIFAFLCFNVFLFFLDRFTAFNWWKMAENPGGFFPNTTLWAGFSVLSLPILFSWKKLAVVPCFIGILFGGSTSVWFSFVCGVFWMLRKNMKVLVVGVVSALFLVFTYSMLSPASELKLIHIRLNTWGCVIKEIANHPYGIGFLPLAYSNAMQGKAGVLPHPASDVLNFVLTFGWLSVPLLFMGVVKFVQKITDSPLGTSLFMAAALSMVQTSISFPHIGVLVWAVWMCWRIDVDEKVYKPAIQIIEGDMENAS